VPLEGVVAATGAAAVVPGIDTLATVGAIVVVVVATTAMGAGV
jgi:hypothetical protein